jgi:protein SCO1/2
VPRPAAPTLSRRSVLAASLAGVAVVSTRMALAHNDVGVLTPPLPAPAIDLTLQDGSTTSLPRLLSGHTSAIQLMFTSCQATCPIQGALFAQGARKLGDRLPDAQWISLSIDPTRDDPAALRAWMARFGTHPRWLAARPDPAHLETLVSFLKSKQPGADPHTVQAYFFNRRSQLVVRSVDFPPVAELVRLFEAIAARD